MNYVGEVRLQLVFYSIDFYLHWLIDTTVASGPLIIKLVLPRRPNIHQKTKPPSTQSRGKNPATSLSFWFVSGRICQVVSLIGVRRGVATFFHYSREYVSPRFYSLEMLFLGAPTYTRKPSHPVRSHESKIPRRRV